MSNNYQNLQYICSGLTEHVPLIIVMISQSKRKTLMHKILNSKNVRKVLKLNVLILLLKI